MPSLTLSLWLFSLVPTAVTGVESPLASRDQFANKALSLAETLSGRLVDPITDRELLAAGASSVSPDPASWDGVFESTPARDECVALLHQLYDEAITPHGPNDVLHRFTAAVGAAVPGGARPVEAAAARVQEQLVGNRYEGIGVQVSIVDGRPRIDEVLPRGPALAMGLRAGDVVLAVDDEDSSGRDLAWFIARSRGEIGTTVTYRIARDGGEPWSVAMTRAEVPRESVRGVARDAEGAWMFRESSLAVAEVELVEIHAGTVEELRVASRRLRREGARAVVLDVRRCFASDPHYALLVADALLDEGPIGTLRDANGERFYRSSADSLLGDLPAVALIGPDTGPAAAWLMAVLRQRGRVELVGKPASASQGIREVIEIPGWSIRFDVRTGYWMNPSPRGGVLDVVEPDEEVRLGEDARVRALRRLFRVA